MVDVCHLDKNEKCDETISSSFHVDVTPSTWGEQENSKKNSVIDDMFTSVQKCYDDDKCETPIVIKAIGWDKCDACEKHIPRIQEQISGLQRKGVNVDFESLDIKDPSVNQLFKRVRCQGTPCVIVQDEGGNLVKAYEGDLGDVNAISTILGFKNPLFYDIEGDLPSRLVKTKFKKWEFYDNEKQCIE